MNINEFRADMVRLVTALIPDIQDDYRAYDDSEDDAAPSMLLTIGADANGWSYQTGDNSYTGGAYGFADWSSVALYRDSDPESVADEIIGGFPDDFEFAPDHPAGIETMQATAPSAWASYLVNGDASGLEDDEQTACDAWVESLAPFTACVAADDAGFIKWHDARNVCDYAADCQTYTFQKVAP